MTAAIYIYLAGVIENIGALLAITGVGGLTLFGIATFITFVHDDKYHGKDWAWIIPTVCLVVGCFIPTQKTMYMMAGAVLGEQALESKIGQQLKEMLELKLNQQIEELKKEKK